MRKSNEFYLLMAVLTSLLCVVGSFMLVKRVERRPEFLVSYVFPTAGGHAFAAMETSVARLNSEALRDVRKSIAAFRGCEASDVVVLSIHRLEVP